MQSTETMTGGLAEEPRAEPARANELESDREGVSASGSSMGSAKKRPNPWDPVMEKFCAAKTDEEMKGLEEASDEFLEDHATQ